MKKKVWEKPKLIVLFRGKPEEAVLETCKIAGIRGPRDSNSTCDVTEVALCAKCLFHARS